MSEIIGATAESERNQIRERVVAGMQCARRCGKKRDNSIGRPKRIFDREEAIRLRESDLSIEKIAGQMGTGAGTVVRVIRAREAAFQKASA